MGKYDSVQSISAYRHENKDGAMSNGGKSVFIVLPHIILVNPFLSFRKTLYRYHYFGDTDKLYFRLGVEVCQFI